MASGQREFAGALHKQQTGVEDILWQRLRGSRFHGAKFRPQVPFDRFVVDFYCHAAKLVVEIDGKQHEWFSDYDAGRTESLERMGVRVVRFTNAEVCDDLDLVPARLRGLGSFPQVRIKQINGLTEKVFTTRPVFGGGSAGRPIDS